MIKDEIQNFIIWYLPAIAISYFISSSIFLSDTGSITFGYRLDFLSSHLSSIICSVWLFIFSSRHDLNKWLWGIFGLGANLFAIVIYFVYVSFNELRENKK
jgi:hypothetical protein